MSESPASKPASGGRGIPLSPAQQAALLPERLRGRQSVNLSLALEITGALDAAAVERAAAALVERHEILRTVYPDDRRIPYQRVVEAPDTALAVIDLADADGLSAVLAADAAHRFDLVAELPIRLRLYRLPERAVLSIVVHPIAADDRSVELIAAELLGSAPAAARVAQYRSYAMAQVKSLVGNAADDTELTYWTDHLAGLPERADLADPAPADAAAARPTLRLSAGALEAAGGDAEAVVSAALAAVLVEAGLGHDVPIGIVDAARATLGDTGLGAYANYLVLRVDTESAATARERIAAVAGRAAQAREHAATRIERLTHQLRGAAAVADGVPFQALVHVRTAGSVEDAGLPARELARGLARPHGADLVADVLTGADGATVTLDFPAVAGAQLDALGSALEQLLAAWLGAPDAASAAVAEVPQLFDRTAALYAGVTGLGGEPETEAERLIADTIREVLELDEDDPVGRSDTFFSLGGDSIAALRLVTQLGEHGYALDVQKVFEFPAVREMAEQLAEADAAPEQTEASAPVAPMAASGLDPAALQALGRKFAAR